MVWIILILSLLAGCRPAHLTLLQNLREGDMSAVSNCLAESECKQQINDTELSGYTPLHVAASNGNVQAVEMLLKAGADVNALTSLLNTPLIESFPVSSKLSRDLINRHTRIVELLINAGSDVNARNQQGNTPLHFAALIKVPEVADILLKAGADPNAKNNDKLTPLMYSFLYDTHCRETIDLLINNGADINASDSDGKTVLIKAIENLELPAILTLIESDADPFIKDSSGMDIFLYAGVRGDLTILDTLIQLYPVWDTSRCNEGNTILHYLSEFGHSDGVTLILDHGFNINELNRMGESVLFPACRNHHLATIETILNAGIEINIQNSEGQYAFEAVFSQEREAEISEIQSKIIHAFMDAGFSLAADKKLDESIKARFFYSAAEYHVVNNDNKNAVHYFDLAQNSYHNAAQEAQEYIEFLERKLKRQKRGDFWLNLAGYVLTGAATGVSSAMGTQTGQRYKTYTYVPKRRDNLTPMQYINHIKEFKSDCNSMATASREKSSLYSK